MARISIDDRTPALQRRSILLAEYLGAACFRDVGPETGARGQAYSMNPWRRPCAGAPDVVMGLDWSLPLEADDVGSTKARVVHQALFNIYDQGLLFLPLGGQPWSARALADYQTFYDPELVALGGEIRPWLEKLAFSALARHVEPSGPWTLDTLREYLAATLKEHEAGTSAVCDAVRASPRPLEALQYVVKQQCSDALIEASGMSRYLGGSFGRAQSELTKVLIDEYGFGVHADKHSTLFEVHAASLGLRTDVHAYFREYDTASLLAANYFHYITLGKIHWPRYVGAIYRAEATLPHLNALMAKTVADVAPAGDTRYFTEHVEIDGFHRRMVLENVLVPLVEAHGESWIPEILRGFEEFRFVGDLAGAALIRGINALGVSAKRSAEGAA